MSDTDWWLSFYDASMADVLATRTPDSLDRLARSILRLADVGPKARVFDQCCGCGDVALALARQGVQVDGVDASAVCLARARASTAGLAARFFEDDARRFTTMAPCDLAINWSTSFGYCREDADNLALLRCACASLRAGGLFLLETLYPPAVFRRPVLEMQTRMVRNGRTLQVRRRAAWEPVDGGLRTEWTLADGDAPAETRTSFVRLYMPHEIVRLGRAAGFADISFMADAEARPLSLDYTRCLAVMRKA
jgi:SAM-dependent methyltransferase